MPVVQHVEVNANGDLDLFEDEVTRFSQSNVIQYSPFNYIQTPGQLIVTNMYSYKEKITQEKTF